MKAMDKITEKDPDSAAGLPRCLSILGKQAKICGQLLRNLGGLFFALQLQSAMLMCYYGCNPKRRLSHYGYHVL